MKIKFDTRSGVDTKRWECLLTVSCVPDDETAEYLLANGWLFDPLRLDWYMSRSVRIDLSKWSARGSSAESMGGYKWDKISDLDERDVNTLKLYRSARDIIDYPYDTFNRCGTIEIERGSSKLGDCWYMTVQLESSALYPICAFEKVGTKSSPGKACWTRACQTSKDRGASHLYVYEGYGVASSYKANCAGFEWWDGTRWSDNKDLYLECVRNDFKD